MASTGHRRSPASYVERRVGVGPVKRAQAFAALGCDAAGFAILVLLVLARPLHALAILLIALVFLASVFVALTSVGSRRTLAAAVAVLFGAAVVVSILFWSATEGEPSVGGVAVMALFGLGALLARFALRVPPPSGPDLFQVRGERTTRHPVLIVNLRSGGGKAERFDIPGACRGLGIDVSVLEPGTDLTELARDAVARGADALGMAGGDGSLGLVAAVAADHDVPFVCVPAGTRNHFALDMGLDRDDPVQALASFVNGEERRIDLARVNERIFINNVSLGVYAAVVEQESYRDAKLETTLGLLPELWDQGGPWFDLHFDVPDHGRLDSAAILQVSNNPYGRELGRRDRLDTGNLGVITADPTRIGELVGLTVLAAAGQGERASALWSWAAPTLDVESGQDHQSIGLDGETISMATPLHFESLPGALRVLVPAGTRVGLSEQHLGYQGTYQALLGLVLGIGPSEG